MNEARISPTIQFAQSRWTGKGSVRIAWALWCIALVAMVIVVARNPDKRTVTTPYRQAAIAFRDSQPVYSPGRTGWLYPIQSAMVFVPFATEPRVIGEVLWRITGIGLFAFAIWRLAMRCGVRAPQANHNLFLLLSIFALPPAFSSMRNGQMNLEQAALFALACADMMEKKWWRTAIWLGLAIACKPIAIVVVLLFTALNRPLWWRVPMVMVVVAALPYAHPDWGYVAEQYRAGLSKVLESSDPRDIEGWRPADITSLLGSAGLHPSHSTMNAVRALIALVTLGLAYQASRVFDRVTFCALALALACSYLMLFNPRNEASTFAILGPPVAVLIAWSLVQNKTSPRSVVLVVLGIVFGFAQLMVPRGRELWIRPGLALAMFAAIGLAIMVPRLRRHIPRMPQAATGAVTPA